MSQTSEIEWTDATWNPVRGCDKISAGCARCYVETFAERFRGVPGHPYERGFDIRIVPEKLLEPLEWASAKLVFVNSMSDLFHDAIPVGYIQAVARVMQATLWHTYQILTKRAGRLQKLLSNELSWAAGLENIWWGVSVKNKKHGLPRISLLQSAPARTRFLSIEPLLEHLGEIDIEGIHWVIVGGESGHGARPMQEAWVRSIQRQCERARVPFFFKQWGGVQKKKAGRELDCRIYDEMPLIKPIPIMSLSERRRTKDDLASLWPL